MLKRLLYLIPGIVLAISLFMLSNQSLSQADLTIYQSALELQNQMTGFTDFQLSDYPVRFFDGNKDYILSQGQIRQDKPYFKALAATAVEIEGEYQIVLPTIERMTSTMSLLSLGQDTSMSYDSHALQSATLWHEGFHCYQLTSFEENLNRLFPDRPIDNDVFLSQEIDRSDELLAGYRAAEMFLDQAIESQTKSEIKQLAGNFLDKYHTRRQDLTEQAKIFESFYEMIEGTAQYIESQAYLELAGPAAYETYYFDSPPENDRGIAKYYRMGRKICLLLDRVSPSWSENYHFEQSLVSVLEQSLEE